MYEKDKTIEVVLDLDSDCEDISAHHRPTVRMEAIYVGPQPLEVADWLKPYLRWA